MGEMILNQSGFNFSAPVEARSLPANISMTGFETSNAMHYYSGNIVFDGNNLWYLIDDAFDNTGHKLVKRNVVSNQTTEYSLENGVNGNTGLENGIERNQKMVFDGHYIWLMPYRDGHLAKVNTKTGTITGYPLQNGKNGNTNLPDWFLVIAVVFDGNNIWALAKKDFLVKINTATGTMTGYKIENISYCSTMVYGNNSIWLVPDGLSVLKSLLVLDINTMEIVEHPFSAPTYNTYSGGVYDGQYLWIVPHNGNQAVIKFNPDSNEFIEYSTAENVNGNQNMGNGYSFTSAAFDGQYIWMGCDYSDRIVRINKITGTMLERVLKPSR
jgi:streptogramin lyase